MGLFRKKMADLSVDFYYFLLYNNIKRKKIHDPTQFGTGFEIPSKIL